MYTTNLGTSTTKSNHRLSQY